MGRKTGSGFNGSKWYANLIHKRTKKALQAADEAFILSHEEDTDEELLAYLTEVAAELKHPPRMIEVTGAELLCRRFGSWERTMSLAGYDHAYGPAKLTNTRRYKEEYKRQQELYRQEKKEKKERK